MKAIMAVIDREATEHCWARRLLHASNKPLVHVLQTERNSISRCLAAGRVLPGTSAQATCAVQAEGRASLATYGGVDGSWVAPSPSCAVALPASKLEYIN